MMLEYSPERHKHTWHKEKNRENMIKWDPSTAEAGNISRRTAYKDVDAVTRLLQVM